MPTWGLVYWPMAIIIVSATVMPAELFALFTSKANTLSDYCWYELNVTTALTMDRHTIAWWLSLLMWGMFVTAITMHIWFKSW